MPLIDARINKGFAESRIASLSSRMYGKKRTFREFWMILGDVNPYYTLNIVMNSFIYGIYYEINGKTFKLANPRSAFSFPDEEGNIIGTEYASSVNERNQWVTSNGEVSKSTLAILTSIANLIGSLIVLSTHRSHGKPLVLLLCVLSVAAYLTSQASLFSFIDRLAFVAEQAISKALLILSVLLAFETGPSHYNVFAVGFLTFVGSTYTYIFHLIYKKFELSTADTYFTVFNIVNMGLYLLLCPNPLIRAVVNRDVPIVTHLLKRFGIPHLAKAMNVEAALDDIIFRGYVPTGSIDGILYLWNIKEFRNKMIWLTLLCGFQQILYNYEGEIISTIVPHGYSEAVLTGNVSAGIAIILGMWMIHKFGRRPVAIIVFFVLLLINTGFSLMQFESFSYCFDGERPASNKQLELLFLFMVWKGLNTIAQMVVMLMILEHIPTIYRSYVYPLVMVIIAMIRVASKTLMTMDAPIYDMPEFTRPNMRYSGLCLLIVVFCIDNSSYCPLSTCDVPVYTKLKSKVLTESYKAKVKEELKHRNESRGSNSQSKSKE